MIDLVALFERILAKGRETERVVTVHETPDKITKMVYGKDGYEAPVDYDKDPIDWSHTMNSLEGFIAFVNSAHVGDKGCVFVNDERVYADLNYQERGHKSCKLPLQQSDELEAVMEMTKGVGQKRLWQLLITKLPGCIDDSLLLAVGNVSMHSKSSSEVEIKTSGVVSGGRGASVTVSMAGQSTEEIRVDWTATVRIWDCFDKKFEIPLRLVISASDDLLKFTFHPIRLDNVFRSARADLVKHLDKAVKNFDVYDGRASS